MEKRTRAATAGSLAAMAAFGASELTAGLLGSVPSLVESIGDVIVDTVPTPIKDWAIAVFGVYDKLALIIGIIAVGLLVGAVVGLLAAGKRWVGPFVFVVFGVAGVVAAVSQGGKCIRRRAKAAPFSRCRSETTSVSWTGSRRTPSGRQSTGTPANSKPAAPSATVTFRAGAFTAIAPRQTIHLPLQPAAIPLRHPAPVRVRFPAAPAPPAARRGPAA